MYVCMAWRWSSSGLAKGIGKLQSGSMDDGNCCGHWALHRPHCCAKLWGRNAVRQSLFGRVCLVCIAAFVTASNP